MQKSNPIALTTAPQKLVVLFLIGMFLFCLLASPAKTQEVAATVIEAQAAPQSVDLSGRWCGSWMSRKRCHGGRLSATFCRIDACHVRATFKGTFAKIIPFRYPATLKIIDETPGQMVLSGSQRLGPVMGSFEYRVTITNNRFDATYQSKRDYGTWTLIRSN